MVDTSFPLWAIIFPCVLIWIGDSMSSSISVFPHGTPWVIALGTSSAGSYYICLSQGCSRMAHFHLLPSSNLIFHFPSGQGVYFYFISWNSSFEIINHLLAAIFLHPGMQKSHNTLEYFLTPTLNYAVAIL